ncbi:unnamed protein product [Linum tenue]|uniref:Uncharacterized protein n=1 Tax=Linum tenue TaxID=586396 RepID=A0AAV0S0D5_9ROSI|nr:unnamed protein product [Linum tenue]
MTKAEQCGGQLTTLHLLPLVCPNDLNKVLLRDEAVAQGPSSPLLFNPSRYVVTINQS